MYHGTEMPSFGDIWRDLQKKMGGGESLRNTNDDVERRFWKKYMNSQGQNGPDPYSARIWDEINYILGDSYYDSIIEIGPGWGNYSFNLAERCRNLTCVDMSPDTLRYIKQTGLEYGFHINTVNEKWEDYRGKSADMVFAFNCFYRMSDIEECLAKIDRCGDRFHIIGMTSGPEQEYLVDYEKILGLKVRFHRLDYIILLNVLYQNGIDCNVHMVDLTKDIKFCSLDQAVEKTSRRIISGEYSSEDLIRILKKYLKKEEDGLYHYCHHFKAAVIYW
ncbi:class I SAM-dependent methyltransferase [Methanomethylophilus alvi]|uniref:class I SAM-dependent methyltransferase n=1 Tax=Methanomethylophilus alvi TaxID=1291540 RepID=UPI0037DCF495